MAKTKTVVIPKLLQPARTDNRVWVCNECGAREFTGSVSEEDLRWLSCSSCGGDEFHKED